MDNQLHTQSRATRRNRAIRLAAIALLAGGGIAAAAGVLAARHPKRFAVVQESVLYRSAQPTTDHIRRLVDTVGLRTVLIVRSGTSQRVPDEVEFARGLGLNVVHIPIPSGVAITDEQVRDFFDCVDNPANRPILIHCSAGRHRTGLLCALYRIERQGWSVDRAMEEMCSFGFDQQAHAVVLNQLRAYRPGDWGHQPK